MHLRAAKFCFHMFDHSVFPCTCVMRFCKFIKCKCKSPLLDIAKFHLVVYSKTFESGESPYVHQVEFKYVSFRLFQSFFLVFFKMGPKCVHNHLKALM